MVTTSAPTREERVRFLHGLPSVRERSRDGDPTRRQATGAVPLSIRRRLGRYAGRKMLQHQAPQGLIVQSGELQTGSLAIGVRFPVGPLPLATLTRSSGPSSNGKMPALQAGDTSSILVGSTTLREFFSCGSADVYSPETECEHDSLGPRRCSSKVEHSLGMREGWGSIPLDGSTCGVWFKVSCWVSTPVRRVRFPHAALGLQLGAKAGA